MYRRCLDCRSVYQDPRIVHEYDEGYWGIVTDPDGNVRDLSKEREFKIKNWYGKSIQHVNDLPPGAILDIGAGMGFFLSAINTNWEKHAVEISEYSSVRIADNVNQVILYNQIDDIAKEDYFDVVMFYHVIEHLKDPHEVLERIHQILKPNGILIVGTPNVASIASKLFGTNFRLYDPGHLFLTTPQSLRQMLIVNRFSVFMEEYPYWKTAYFNIANIARMLTPWKLSPPFYGSVMTYYAVAEK